MFFALVGCMHETVEMAVICRALRFICDVMSKTGRVSMIAKLRVDKATCLRAAGYASFRILLVRLIKFVEVCCAHGCAVFWLLPWPSCMFWRVEFCFDKNLPLI